MHSHCAIKNLDLNFPIWILWRIFTLLDSCAHTLYNFKVIINGFNQIITCSVHLIHVVESSRTQRRTGKCLLLYAWSNNLLLIILG